MLSFIRGTLLQKGNGYIIIENQGIGYKILVTPEIYEEPTGATVSLYLYHKSSDEGQSLFGLKDFPTLQFFELLITVTGVGPKMALGMLSASKPEVLEQAIANQDLGILTRMSGVGKKTAERMILELKNKVGAHSLSSGSSDTYDALLSLGYSAAEARLTLSKIDTSKSQEEQLKAALKILST